MANTYKNIVITPNKGSSTGDPTIVFSGANTTVNTDITLRVYPTSNGTLSFEGSAGQLFSITNDLTGTLFSVNDISGMPSIEVDANGKITLAQYSGNVGIGTGSPAYKLDVAGDMRVIGNVIMGDASTDTITINGSVISLGNNQSIDSGTLFIDATNDRVGIGNTSPPAKLTVAGSVLIGGDQVNLVDFRLQRNSTTKTVNHWYNSPLNSPWYTYGENIIWTGERIGTVEPTQASRPYYEAFSPAGGYREFGFANVTSGAVATSNLIPSLVLKNNGYVGIGTIDPTSNLHVVGTANITSNLLVQGSDVIQSFAAANNWANTKLSNSTGTFAGTLTITGDLITQGNVILGDASTDTITLNGSTITLGNNQSIDAGTLFIDATNNEVGIGTTSPTSNLHVIGTANITSSVVVGEDMFTQNVKFNGGSTVRAYSTLSSNSFIITNGATTNKYALQVESGAGTGGILVYRSSSNYSIGDSGSVLDIRSTNWGGVSFVATGSIAFAANNGIFRFSGDESSYNASNGVIQVVANASVGFYIRFTKDGFTTTSNLRANDVFTVAYDGTVNTKSNVEAVYFKGSGSLLTNVISNSTVANTGTVVGSRNVLNFIPGANVVITFADDAVGDRVNVSIDSVSTAGALSYTANVGNNSSNTFNITHALNTTTIIPAVREIATGYYVYPDMKVTSANNIVLEFVSAPTTNQYSIILLGA